MRRKIKGFTIAELLISLLIISLVLSAAIPTITRKKVGNEAIWQWSQSPNSAYFGVSEHQSAIIGNTYKPDGGVLTNFDEDTQDLLTDNKFVNSGDKLILVKKAQGLSSSHISFYDVGVDGTTSSVKYNGRLVLDKGNIGLGLAALANSQNNAIANTAVGHFSLVANESGTYNTAIGAKALAKNKANFNTAIGAYSGFETVGNPTLTHDENEIGNYNTGVGAYTLNDNKTGQYNTAVGFMALGTPTESITNSTNKGNRNTAIGAGACNYVTGDGNICVGYNAGSDAIHDTNIPSRYGINSASNNILYIGSSNIPLVLGRLEKLNDDATANTKRFFGLNTQDFDINTPMADYNVFRITAIANASILNFIPYQTDVGVSRQFKVSGSHDATTGKGSIYLNSQKYTATNTEASKYGTLSLNGGRILIDEDDNGTTSINAGNGTDKTLGNYKINVTKDNISLFGKGTAERNLIFKVNNDNDVTLTSNASFIKFTTKVKFTDDLSVDSPKVYFTSSEVNFNVKSGTTTGAVNFNVPSTFNRTATFKNTYAIFEKDLHVTGIKNIGGGIEGMSNPNPPTDSISKALEFAWSGIYAVNSRIYSYHSDARLKNITGNSTAGLNEINKIEVKNFTFKNDKEKKPHVGVIAQQLQKIFPNSVIKGDDGYLRVNNDEMFFAMINSIKELFAKIQNLTAKVTGLDNRLKKLEQENAQLKKQNADFEARLKKLEAKTK